MESKIFRLHATSIIQRYYLVLDFCWDSFEETPIVQGGGKNISSSLVVYKPKCKIILAQYDARICGYSLGCCKQEEEKKLTQLSKHTSVNCQATKVYLSHSSKSIMKPQSIRM
jgi:hypothetical protein